MPAHDAITSLSTLIRFDLNVGCLVGMVILNETMLYNNSLIIISDNCKITSVISTTCRLHLPILPTFWQGSIFEPDMHVQNQNLSRFAT